MLFYRDKDGIPSPAKEECKCWFKYVLLSVVIAIGVVIIKLG